MVYIIYNAPKPFRISQIQLRRNAFTNILLPPFSLTLNRGPRTNIIFSVNWMEIVRVVSESKHQ